MVDKNRKQVKIIFGYLYHFIYSKSDLTGRGDFTLTFFRGNLLTFGGCEMYKQCFNNVFIININDLCPNKCTNQGECKDNFGCVCQAGFTTHDCSMKNKCKDDCSKNGICHNSAKCQCFAGWAGTICSTMIPCPKNCTSTENGVCQVDSSCKCNPGFAGNDCSQYTIVGNNTLASSDPFKELTAIESKRITLEADDIKKQDEKQASNAKSCPNNCSGHGKCNFDSGNCTCDVRNFLNFYRLITQEVTVVSKVWQAKSLVKDRMI